MRTIVNILLAILTFVGIVNAIRYPIYQQVLDAWFDTNGEGIKKAIFIFLFVAIICLLVIGLAEGTVAFLSWYLKW